jgi:proteic killer suppression protein
VILSFADEDTESFARGERVKRFEGFSRAAERKLDRLDVERSLSDLARLPGNQLEKLRGDREGQYSIRINDQYRICFRWNEEPQGFRDVEIFDYH